MSRTYGSIGLLPSSNSCKSNITNMDFVLFITISEFINIVKGAQCQSRYYHCSGYLWCCPNGYSCTGTSMCNANSFNSPYSPYLSSYYSSISSARIGMIVGGCMGGLFCLVIVTCIIVYACKARYFKK
ncbi:hypothetical protein AM593_10112, partial [Mytilus galloprovincialis]